MLGCNIHDGMLGYIVVVDTPHFALTNEQGVALIDGVPDGDYVVAAWTPRVRPHELARRAACRDGAGHGRGRDPHHGPVGARARSTALRA